MGKRELLLIGGFVLFGVIVYYATAPAAAPGEQRFSISKLLDEVRREIHGNPGSAETNTSTVIPVSPSISEIRIEIGSTPLTVVGEDRTDVACELSVRSSGYDEVEASRLAQATHVKTTDAGSAMALWVDYPKPGVQRATLALKVPKGLTVRVQPSRGRLDISDVKSVELVEARGQVTVRRVAGRLVAMHRGGKLELEDIASLKLNARGSGITLKGVKNDAVVQVQAGELRGSALGGTIEIDSNDTRIHLEEIAAAGEKSSTTAGDRSPARKSVRMNTVGGSVTLTHVASEVRIDGRDTKVDVTLEKPAPLAIYTEGGEPIDVTLPTGGIKLDALATDSRLVVPEGLGDVKVSGDEQRVIAAIGGGGPTITLRAVRGDITVRSKKPDA